MRKALKIGFLSHSGASIYHFRMPIIRALLARGDEVFIITPNDEYTAKLKALNLPFVIVPYTLARASVNPFVVISNFFALCKVLKGLNLDLLQTNAHKSNTLGTIAAKKAGIKHCVALVEGLGSFYIDKDLKSLLVRGGINLLYKIAFKCADKFICVSEANANFMRNLGLKEDKIAVIKSVGVNLKHFCPLKISKEQKAHFLRQISNERKTSAEGDTSIKRTNDKKGERGADTANERECGVSKGGACETHPNLHSASINENLPIVLMVARALWHKGVREFYEAAALLKNHANFIFAGGVDENKSCAPLGFLQSGAVVYLGKRDDIANLMNLCDIFVLPSYKEGFAQTIVEAKACAKPCVVSEVEGCVEAVRNGVDGLYCKVRDSKDLAYKIALLLDDAPFRSLLAQNAFKDALNYDENTIATKYLQIYDEILA